jgi:hypothetical protein
MKNRKSNKAKRKPMQLVINEKIRDVLEDPYTMHYLAAKLIRRRPRYMPWLVWKGLLWIVLAPAAKEPAQPDA